MPARLVETKPRKFKREKIDPITLDIIENAMLNARWEMDTVLFRTAMSPGIREQHDEFPMIANVDGKMVVGQFGSFIHGFKEAYDGTIEEGDIFLTSDPYACNGAVSHANDWLLLRPIFKDGRLIAYSAMFGHMTDIGGKVPGSLPTDARQIYEEGICVPPTKIYKKDVLQEDVLELILHNCRLPHWNRSDFNAIVAAVRTAEKRVIELAARHGIMLNVHEPIKDTGERRTWPNMMTREGARGMEYNAWAGDGGNPPEHETILYFTRMISGPLDYTPGVFDILLASSPDGPRSPEAARVRTTLAKQLALYVVLYSPLQMAADLPENYEDRPAFQFIRDVPVDWEVSATIGGRIGDFVVVLRKDRDGPDWYIGAITDEDARSLEVPLSFLPDGESFVAEIYADGDGAHWLHDPLAIEISSRDVNSQTTLTVDLAPGGGQAIRIRPAT
ncbi:MAG: hydantoinase B/oxoprolinase family protein [Gemmatimonadota bacterium]